MRYIHSEETLDIPESVKVSIKTRIVNVEGPRGTNHAKPLMSCNVDEY
jgi:ribosomal protein L6P/L9E